jgi:protein O-mannosyl-transferase
MARRPRKESSRRNAPVPDAQGSDRRATLAVCVLLLLAIALVFGQTVHHDFVNYDDDVYVTDNPHLSHGVTARGVAWAFTDSHASNWHPLTWLSHMMDVQLYGVAHPAGHHLTSVLLHGATAILLFLVLLRMTSDLWPSAFVASLFAVHPLHVESVAWIAERKDVLSGLFFVLTLAAYVWYARTPFSYRRYVLVLASFALGLLSKPMLVTLPFVLLLLDYWPLGRLPQWTAFGSPDRRQERPAAAWRLVLEKMPMLALAAACSVVTYAVQETARGSLANVPLPSRVANALVSYVVYLEKFVYPVGLAVFYPHPEQALPAWKIAGACLLLAGISTGVLAWRRRHPYLLVGWFWYLGMLVPVIGLVQVGSQAMADRYTYLTQIGLYVAVAWGGLHVARTSAGRRRACAVAAGLALVVMAGSAWRQVSFWRDSETLWSHALSVTSRNHEAHNGLARALARRGQTDAAIAQYAEALAIKPDHVDAHNNLGTVLAGRGEHDAAITQYRIALRIKPDHAEAHNNLALALADRGQVDAAIAHYEKALALEPRFAEAHYNLGNALAGRGQADQAAAEYEQALAARPDFAEAHNNLGTVLAGRGDIDSAIAHYRKALAINPDFISARENLALVLAERNKS